MKWIVVGAYYDEQFNHPIFISFFETKEEALNYKEKLINIYEEKDYYQYKVDIAEITNTRSIRIDHEKNYESLSVSESIMI